MTRTNIDLQEHFLKVLNTNKLQQLEKALRHYTLHHMKI